ncbi:MAG: hypothetical protein E5W81_33695 [Mesorhizobium sp.]|uniref:hypothetical protein n=1 Tax=Mesorhizobium sp. ISC25 TaxID=3077335 RepID=UPI00120607CF|nr:MAG: hypothetical protein E5W81_33695 [Mesorhizobium sp.]
MSLQGTACPADLAMLTKALDDRCRELGLADGDPGREVLGRRVMDLFASGQLSAEDLKLALSGEILSAKTRRPELVS